MTMGDGGPRVRLMTDETHRDVPLAARASAAIYLLLGAGFGVGAAVTLAMFARDGELPMTPWGFRSLDGPYARESEGQTFVLGSALVAVCAADVIAGAGLWRARRAAAVLAILTTPVAFVLARGFELPFLLIGIPLRVGLLAVAWPRLR